VEARRVHTIPAVISRYTAEPINSHRKRRVAGYARVSTDHEDQVTSYEAQVDYYTSYIKGRMTGSLLAYTRMKESRQPIPGTVMGLIQW
jgi:predicted site-specific integrase-resolvase